MRTVNYRDGVLLPAANEIGIDTTDAELGRDHARNLTSKINLRLRPFLGGWPWPDWHVLEERAFRVLWRDDLQFRRDTGFGAPDELFYLADDRDDSAYYRVKTGAPSDPPVGTLPTDTTYFEDITLAAGERYLAREVTCRITIGEMIGVFNADPRANPDTALGIPFMPSERGIEVLGVNTGLTVWAYFKKAIPQFTSELYVASRQYQQGETRLYISAGAAGDGECFRARTLVPVNHPPSLPAYWAKIPFPDFAAEAVIKGAAGDAAEDAVAAAPLWAQAKDAAWNEVNKTISEGHISSYRSLGKLCLVGRVGSLGYFAPSGLTGWLQTLAGGTGPSVALTNSCMNEFGDVIMGPGTSITSNTTLAGEPFDLPATEGQDYINVDFGVLFGGDLVAGWEVLDGHFEYVGSNTTVDVPVPPVVMNRAASGFRAQTSTVFGADAADYHYVGRIVGTVA